MCPDAVASNQILEVRAAWFQRVLGSLLFQGFIERDDTTFDLLLVSEFCY